MPDTASFTYLDHSNEKASMQFDIAVVTAANFDTQVGLLDDLRDAIAGITLGVLNKRILTHKMAGSANIPTDPFAQRETKWVVGYTDVSTTISGVSNPYFGKKFSVEIACPELTGNLPTSTEYANLSDGGVVEDFVTAFEAFAKSPTGGSVQVSYIRVAGRNL